ncbi:uncharacterized protein LOC129749717 [Uranotaenia lowii]|uniref:uncharacterized protein LOC129749717 n=1 Tax=Uranotaenia lowii TaxID=190385 RepID=UPI00247B0433|nr:uncharacterized protein LOC129749717 [Uranotaenia lowii]
MSADDIRLESVDNSRQQNATASRSDRTKRSRVRGICRCICTRLCISLVIAGILAIVIICVGFLVSYEKDSEVIQTIEVFKEQLPIEQEYWYNQGLDDLKESLNKRYNWKRARNVVLFVANVVSTSAFTKHYTDEKSELLKKFPHVGFLKVQNNISLGTALFSGVNGAYGTAGVDSAVSFDDCQNSQNETHRVKSIVQQAQEVGLNTGLVSNGDLLDSLSSPIYAHVPNVNWQCHSKIPDNEKNVGCLDVATQLASLSPAKDINVLMENHDSSICGDDNRSVKDASELYAIQQTTRVRLSFSSDNKQSFGNLTQEAVKHLYTDNFLLIALWKQSIQDGQNFSDFENSLLAALTLLRNQLSETLFVVIAVPYQNLGSINQDKTQSVEDIIVGATGPMAHLLQGVHDLTYVAHVISFAARLGRFRDSMLANSLFEWF